MPLFCCDKEIYYPSDDTYLILDYFKQNINNENFDGIDIGKINKILDMGTGTGIIAIFLQKILDSYNHLAEIYASDISDKAIKCAQLNVKLNKLNNKIKFIISDLFSSFPPYLEKSFNIIVFNPPYLPSISQEIKNHDLIWNGGDNGIELFIEFIIQMKKFIESNQKYYIYYISSSLSSLESLNQVLIENRLENQILSKKHISFETIYLNRLHTID